MARDKQYRDNAQKFDRDRLHSDEEAIGIIKSLGTKKFDETVDIVVRLGVDPRKADQMIRGTVALPAGTGKDVRVAVFAQGEAATAAREAGAEFVGADDLAAEIEGGMTDFDVAIATPDMMPVVGKLGKVLGPKGLMPNPKMGTVTPNIGEAVKLAKSGQVQFKTEKNGIVQAGIAKSNFDAKNIVENINSFVDTIKKSKPSGAKGTFIKKISLSSTMGVSVNCEIN